MADKIMIKTEQIEYIALSVANVVRDPKRREVALQNAGELLDEAWRGASVPEEDRKKLLEQIPYKTRSEAGIVIVTALDLIGAEKVTDHLNHSNTKYKLPK